MRIFGLDCGIASVGWAVVEIDQTKSAGSIVGLGTRMFDVPETDKEKRPKSEVRRMYRGQRRVIRRARQRMNGVRRILNEHGLLENAASDALRFQGTSPWEVRAKARTGLLSGYELAITLGHIARHRGFKSNAKSRGENDVEGSKMKKAMMETADKIGLGTFGELMATNAAFAVRKRNKEGDFSRTPQRADLEAEVRAIFAAQRKFLNPAATSALETEFLEKAFFQRGLQDSEKMLADCAFEPDEKRTAKRGYSFELFRYLSRLNTIEIQDGRDARRLMPEELSRAAAHFGTSKKISFEMLRKLFKLPDTVSFSSIRREDEGHDVTSRHGEAAAGTRTLRSVLEGAAWDSLVKTPHKLDRIAEIMSFREDLDNIRTGLDEISLEAVVLEKLMDEVKNGVFDKFTGPVTFHRKPAGLSFPAWSKAWSIPAPASKLVMITPPAGNATPLRSGCAAKLRSPKFSPMPSSTGRWWAALLPARR